MEFLQGRIFTDPFLKSITVLSSRKDVYCSMTDALSQLHNVPVSILTNTPPRNFYIRQITALQAISKVQGDVEGTGGKVGQIIRLDEMLDWFKRSVVDDEVRIIHGDYKLDNVVFLSKGLVILFFIGCSSE